jgi:Holliday junction resolvase
LRNRVRRIGFSHERDLVLRFWNKGFAVIRAPASGSRAKRIAYPDIVAIRRGVVFAFEVKTTHKNKPIYVPKHQVKKIREFISRAGGYGFIAVKIIGETSWRFISIDKLVETENNYKIDKDALINSLKIQDILSIAAKNKNIDDYIDKIDK